MKLYCFFVTRTYDLNTPELVDAWDECRRDEQSELYEDAQRKAFADDDVAHSAVVTVEVSGPQLMDILNPAVQTVTGHIVSEQE